VAEEFDPYDPEEARDRLTAALERDDGATIAEVASRYIWILRIHHYGLLMEAFDRLPAECLEEHESLRLHHPLLCAIACDRPVTVKRPPRPEGRPIDDAEANVYLLSQVLARRLSGDLALAVEAAERLNERLHRTRPPVVVGDKRLMPLYHLQIGLTLLLSGQMPRALRSFSLARQFAVLDGSDEVQREASAASALTHAVRGSIDQAERELATSRAVPSGGAPLPASIDSAERIAEALIHLERMDADIGERVRALASYDAPDELWSFTVLALVRFELSRCRPMNALDVISLAFDSHPWQEGTVADDIRISCTIDAFLSLGELSAAQAMSEGVRSNQVLSRLSRVRVQLHNGSHAQAARDCRKLSGALDASAATRAEALLLLCWINLEIDGTVEAHQARVVAQFAICGRHRRSFTTVPGTLIEAIARQLPPEEAEKFSQALSGLPHATGLTERPRLSPGELKVLDELGSSAKTAEIAERLFVSQNTVKTQLASIYRKLGVGNRDDAIASATRLNLLRGDRVSESRISESRVSMSS
jgi:DNA-binding CsgD family transcriptional regulator